MCKAGIPVTDITAEETERFFLLLLEAVLPFTAEKIQQQAGIEILIYVLRMYHIQELFEVDLLPGRGIGSLGIRGACTVIDLSFRAEQIGFVITKKKVVGEGRCFRVTGRCGGRGNVAGLDRIPVEEIGRVEHLEPREDRIAGGRQDLLLVIELPGHHFLFGFHRVGEGGKQGNRNKQPQYDRGNPFHALQR